MSLIFIVYFLVLIGLGIPIVFSLLLAPGVMIALDGNEAFLMLLQSTLYNGMDSFPLMALPFFMLAGEIMNRGGITITIVNFSELLLGHIRGGLAHVNIFSSILFAGLSGSAVADTSAIGSMLIPAMEKNGYTRSFAAAVTAASSVIGPIIPPSGIMILYAFIMNVSVAALFAAGFIPGLMVGLSLMGLTWYFAKKRNFPVASKKASWKERGRGFVKAFWALLAPIILLGGILFGVFTPTEASAVAVLYAFVLCIFITRTVKWKDLIQIFYRTVLVSGPILILVGASLAFSRVITLTGAANNLENVLTAISDNRYTLLFILNILMLIVGMFLDAGPALLILGPILSPIFTNVLGVDPIHFAVIMCMNVTIGLSTPPMGLVLFVASDIARERLPVIIKDLLPFVTVEILIIFLVTYIPSLSLYLPKLLGLIVVP